MESWVVGDVPMAMAANRLMISDRSPAGNQPLAGPEGSWLVFNGELYNAQDLRNELLGLPGVVFRSHADTEVLLHALFQWGRSVIPRLNGMFALAFWHGPQQTLWVARDRSGMKPLYYRDLGDARVYSSEAKALVDEATPTSAQAIPQVLAYRYPQVSAWQGIVPVIPGELHTWQPGPGWRCESWHSTEVKAPLAETPLRTRLTDALLRQLEAQARVGIFLSGGVDSTLLLALMKEEGVPRTPAFAVAHRKEDSAFGTRDGAFAAQAAKQYGTTLEVLTVEPSHLARFDEYITAMDQPIVDSGGFLTWLLAERARSQGMGVVLSGAGADELFGGYHRLAAFQRYLKRPGFWSRMAPLLRGVTKVYPTSRGVPGRTKMQLLRKFAERIGDDPGRTYRKFQGLTLPSDHATFWKGDAKEEPKEGWLAWAMVQEYTGYLVKDVLAVSDVFTMAHSLEMRMPYLDTELVRYAQSLPPEQHLEGGTKALLKAELNALGGKAFTQRRKEGFGLPLGHWIRTGEVNDWLQWLERDDLALWEHVDPAGPRQWLKLHKAGRADFTQEIWNIITLAAWWERRAAGGRIFNAKF